jgi:hypothetical protein
MPPISQPKSDSTVIVDEIRELTSLERYTYWAWERGQMYLRRKAGKPKPWSRDEIFQSFYFTNTFREHDRTTAWFRDNVRARLADSPAVLFATIAFLRFNLIETGETFLKAGLFEEWNTEEAQALLQRQKSEQGKVFTSAYIVPSAGGESKSDECCALLGMVWKQRHELTAALERCTTLRQAHARLQMLPGYGGNGLLAYEIVTDLRHTYLLREATDICTWSNPGPGAMKGLNRILGRPIEQSVSDWEWQRETDKLFELLTCKLARLPKPQPVERREVENALCETSKYECALWGDGRVKRRYPGGADNKSHYVIPKQVRAKPKRPARVAESWEPSY